MEETPIVVKVSGSAGDVKKASDEETDPDSMRELKKLSGISTGPELVGAMEET